MAFIVVLGRRRLKLAGGVVVLTSAGRLLRNKLIHDETYIRPAAR